MGLNRVIPILLAALVTAAQFLAVPAAAQDAPTPSGFPVPRFVSLKAGVANGRAGPEQAHPIVWRYVRAGLPMEVIAETADWRRVRDPDGVVDGVRYDLLPVAMIPLLQDLAARVSKLEGAGYVQQNKTYSGRSPATYLALTPEGRVAFERYVRNLRALLDA